MQELADDYGIALASSYTFTYNFKHQLAVSGNKKASGSTATFSCTTTSNESSESSFAIQQYQVTAIGANTYITSDYISINIPSGKTSVSDTASFSTEKGTSYTYEFWKSTAIGYVVGSGSLTY